MKGIKKPDYRKQIKEIIRVSDLRYRGKIKHVVHDKQMDNTTNQINILLVEYVVEDYFDRQDRKDAGHIATKQIGKLETALTKFITAYDDAICNPRLLNPMMNELLGKCYYSNGEYLDAEGKNINYPEKVNYFTQVLRQELRRIQKAVKKINSKPIVATPGFQAVYPKSKPRKKALYKLIVELASIVKQCVRVQRDTTTVKIVTELCKIITMPITIKNVSNIISKTSKSGNLASP